MNPGLSCQIPSDLLTSSFITLPNEWWKSNMNDKLEG